MPQEQKLFYLTRWKKPPGVQVDNRPMRGRLMGICMNYRWVLDLEPDQSPHRITTVTKGQRFLFFFLDCLWSTTFQACFLWNR